jgi:hypothetical protein
MIIAEEILNSRAEQYSLSHGADAYKKIGDDISIAVASRQGDDAYLLQRVQWRVRKLERLRQITAQLRQSGPNPWHFGPT